MKPDTKTARKYLPYELLCSIPGQISQGRNPDLKGTKQDARIAHDALLFLFMVILPIRQKHIRDARIGAAANSNIFKAPVSPTAKIDIPVWAVDELHRNPHAEFWQIYFGACETKSGRNECAILPRKLVPCLEEYLKEHRPLLAASNNPGTLFVGKRGGPLDARGLTALIGELTTRYGGRQSTLHSIRSSFMNGCLESAVRS
jgi:hypothetical protein